MVKKIKNIIASGLIGLSLAYNISCGPDTHKDNINYPPKIITNNLETIAGEYLETPIEFSDPENDKVKLNLINGPEWLTLENNVLKGSPIHSTIGPNGSQTGTFPIDISATDGINTITEKIYLTVFPNTTDLKFLRTNEDIRFNCENVSDKFGTELGCAVCIQEVYDNSIPPKLYDIQRPCDGIYTITNIKQIKENDLKILSNGVFKAYKELKNFTGSDTPEEHKPIDYHFVADSVCAGGVSARPPNHYTNPDFDKWIICDINKKYDTSGNMIPTSPYATTLDDIKNFNSTTHEGTHCILDENPYYSSVPGEDSGRFFQEYFAMSNGNIISDASGYGGIYFPHLNSFCDLGIWSCGEKNNTWMCENTSLLLFKYLTYNLCISYGFNHTDAHEMYGELKNSSTDTIQNAKCIIDKIISRKLGTQIDTSQAFYDAGISDVTSCGE